MRFIFCGIALFVAGILTSQALNGPPVGNAQVAGTVAPQNGDCDGNGAREITDAIYLLSWLFQGGPEPVASGNQCDAPSPPLDIRCFQTEEGIEVSWENPMFYDSIEIAKDGKILATLTTLETNFTDMQVLAGSVSSYSIRGKLEGVVSPPSSCSVSIPQPPILGQCLVSTGQKRCWGLQNPIDCSFPPVVGQDAYYKAGCSIEGRFTDNGDETITDHCTGLLWTKAIQDLNDDFEITASDKATWEDAINAAEDSAFAGYNDWRLPNSSELFSLINFEVGFSQIHPPFRQLDSVRDENVWSSTSGGSTFQGAFIIGRNYSDGCRESNISCTPPMWVLGKNGLAYVMMVRTFR